MIMSSNTVSRRWLFLVGAIIMSLNVVQFSEIVLADNVNPQFFGLESSPYGVANGEWTTKWWKWLISIPEPQNPARDDTGMNCSLNRDDPNVWFLTGTFGDHAERTCKIPAGKAIFFAHGNECSYKEYPTLKTDEELSQCATTGNEIHQDRGGIMEASLDGVSLEQFNSLQSVVSSL